MPLASPASGRFGLPRTSGARPPPTGPPIVPEANTQGPAFTAFGMRSGVADKVGSQMLFFDMISPWIRGGGVEGAERGSVSGSAMDLEVARQGPRGHEAEGPVRQVAEDAEDGKDHEDPVGLHEQARLLQEKAEPGVSGQDLGRDDRQVRGGE